MKSIRNLVCAMLIFLVGTRAETDDVGLLQEYLRIDTSYPVPAYAPALEFLEAQAAILKLDFKRVSIPLETNETTTVGMATWVGSSPELTSVMLYNHMDVVAVDRSGWTVNPFGGEVIDDKIYGRGAQDMKSVAIQHFLAIRNLQSKGFSPVRTIHIGFFPDEERGGFGGIKLFLNTPEFKVMNIGFVLDEGMHNEADTLEVYYTQRSPLWLKFIMPGTSAHGSLLMQNTAGEKMQNVLNTMLNLRAQEARRLKMDKTITLGDVTSINLNIVEGGIQDNVTPPTLSAVFDIRITPHWDLTEFREFLNKTCKEAGDGVTFELVREFVWEPEAPTDIKSPSWWWTAFQKACQEMNLTIVPRIYPAATDGRFLRALGIPVLGISTFYKTPNLMHAPDEYLHLEDFKQGVVIYEKLIQHLSMPSANNEAVDILIHQTEKINLEVDDHGNKEVLNEKSSSSTFQLSLTLAFALGMASKHI